MLSKQKIRRFGIASPRWAVMFLMAFLILIGPDALRSAEVVANLAATSTDDVTVEVVLEEGRALIVVKHLEQPPLATVSVWVAGSDTATHPPMSGKTTVERGAVVFRPKYALRPGLKYTVGVQTESDAKPVFYSIDVLPVSREKSKVDAVFPSADVLPENTLRFYVQFSGPMRKGEIYRYVRIQEAGGEVVELPFLEIEQEFWSRDSTRLTLLLDPGRIKRGLKPRIDMGPIFVSGKSYEIVVSGDWPDSDGRPLGQDYVKRFKASAEDFDQPDPSRWEIDAPGTGTRDDLVVVFADSIDHSMLFRVIQVKDPKSNVVPGTIRVSDRETEWRFTPSEDWTSGSYTIAIDSNLEDNAGNSITRQFDVDVFHRTEPSGARRVVELTFEVK